MTLKKTAGTRRRFIRNAGLAGAGLGLAPAAALHAADPASGVRADLLITFDWRPEEP